jgi:hypothetical protein
MDTLLSAPAWWVTAIELPALGAMATMLWRSRQEWEARLDLIERQVDIGLGQAREALAAYKLEVAKSYATTGYLKDVETRLTEHLIRIEAKLDQAQSAVR